MTGRSSEAGHSRHGTVLRTVRSDGTAVYRFQGRPGMPPIEAVGFDHDTERPARGHRHAHDFLVLAFVEPGTVYAVPPGQVLQASVGDALDRHHSWTVFFMPEALPDVVAGSPLTWSRHPLLAPFTPGSHEPQPLVVPDAGRADWQGWFDDLAAEVREPARVGAAAAATAALTRLLVATARLTDATGRQPTMDPVVSRVFAVIEERFRDAVSTREVAAELGYTPAHLTTVIRERTGRTVLDWITERRMGEVRRLLTETDLPIRTIALQTGHRDGEYLTRRFRERYGITPLRWRRSAALPADPTSDPACVRRSAELVGKLVRDLDSQS